MTNLKCLNCNHKFQQQLPEDSVIRFDGALVRTFVDQKKQEYANQAKDSFCLVCPNCHQSIIIKDK